MTTADVPLAALKMPKGVREAAIRIWLFFLALYVSVLLCGAAVGVLFLAYHAVWGLEQEGYVSLPANGQALELTGVPGDEIRLLLFEADSAPDNKRSTSYLQVTEAETDLQTTLLVRFEEEGGDQSRPIYARIPVPGVPGKKAASLTGTLWGEVVFRNDEPRDVEVPVHLRVVERGDAETSGYKDTSGAKRANAIFLLVFFLTTGATTALLYATSLEQEAARLWPGSEASLLATGKNGGPL